MPQSYAFLAQTFFKPEVLTLQPKVSSTVRRFDLLGFKLKTTRRLPASDLSCQHGLIKSFTGCFEFSFALRYHNGGYPIAYYVGNSPRF
jgi:hypothetical protein